MQITKNKVAPPFRVCEFDILFGSGISKLGSLVDAAEKKEVIQRKGSWYYFGERRLEQGREKTLQALKEDAQLRRFDFLTLFGLPQLSQRMTPIFLRQEK